MAIFFRKPKSKEVSKKVVYSILDFNDNVVKSFETSGELDDYADKNYAFVQQITNFEFAKEDLFLMRKCEYENDKLVSSKGVYGEVYVKNELLDEKYNFFVDNEGLYSFAKDFGFPAIQTRGWKCMIRKEDVEKIKEIVKKDYKPFALKGSDWPYWFKVNGKLIKSRTSSWQNYLYMQYNYVTEDSLEEYTGSDRCKEHVNDNL